MVKYLIQEPLRVHWTVTYEHITIPEKIEVVDLYLPITVTTEAYVDYRARLEMEINEIAQFEYKLISAKREE